MVELKEITYKELKELRYEQYCKQNGTCPILRQEIEYKDAVFDHKHKIKSEKIGEDGKGLLRGVIHNQANVIEGKIAKLYKRYGLHKFISLPSLLVNIAGYISDPPMKPEYIHPNERLKAKKIGKRDFNRIIKYYFEMYTNRRKLPERKEDKNGKSKIKMNKKFEQMLEKANKLHLHRHKPKGINSLRRK